MTPETLLAFQALWPQHSGHKETAIIRELGIRPARYYQLLNRAARSGDGIKADPITARQVRAQATR
jgi:hypothetical protein